MLSLTSGFRPLYKLWSTVPACNRRCFRTHVMTAHSDRPFERFGGKDAQSL